jgi:hypothetical protein
MELFNILQQVLGIGVFVKGQGSIGKKYSLFVPCPPSLVSPYPLYSSSLRPSTPLPPGRDTRLHLRHPRFHRGH